MAIAQTGSLLGRLPKAAWLRLRSVVAVATARSASERRLHSVDPRRVLVVCYGNIYRSAFIGELLRERLAGGVEVRSVGFHKVEGRPSPERHVEVSGEFGVRLDRHRSRLITSADLEWADLIVLMDRHNWARLTAMGAEQDKLVWLGALGSGPVEVSDPYTLADDEARRIVSRLRDLGEELTARIRERLRSPPSTGTR
jgi:protein-tyrosine phosphatase